MVENRGLGKTLFLLLGTHRKITFSNLFVSEFGHYNYHIKQMMGIVKNYDINLSNDMYQPNNECQ